jgi:hypothetical protein
MPDTETTSPAFTAAEALKWVEENPNSPAIHHDEDDNSSPSTTPEEEGGDDASQVDEDAEIPPEEELAEAEGEAVGTDGGEADGDAVPELDPLITELAKGNPQAEKRVQEIAKGLQKLKDEATELRSELEKTRPQAEALDLWNQALLDPGRVEGALQQLVVSLSAHHGRNPADLLPILLPKAPPAPKTDSFGRVLPDWEAAGYGSAKEMELEQALRTMAQEVSGLKAGAEQLQKEREASRKAAEFREQVSKVAPGTIAKLAKLENGWRVTPAMVEKAITELPNWDPVRAVKAVYADELKTHHAKAMAETRPTKGPEMPRDARGKGHEAPPPRPLLGGGCAEARR